MRKALSCIATIVLLNVAHAQTIPPLSGGRAASGMPAAAQAVPIPAGRQVYYAPEDLRWVNDTPRVRRATVIGETVTFSIDQMGEKASATLTHPAETVLQEQTGSTMLDNTSAPMAVK